MSSRPLLSGTPTVEVNQTRCDELVHKEAPFDTIVKIHKQTSGFSFHDIVGHLFREQVRENVLNDKNDLGGN